MLPEIVVTGQKRGNKPDKKAIHTIRLEDQIIEEEHLKQGSHIIKWDSFNDSGILNTEDLLDSLRFQISVVGSDGQIAVVSSKEVKTVKIEPAAQWVKATITNTDHIKNIDVSININLVDGGEKGLSCSTVENTTSYSPITGLPVTFEEKTICDWDKIPASEITSYRKLIKSRNIDGVNVDFNYLSKLTIDGINKYWSRNRTRDSGVTVNMNNFKVNTQAKNTSMKPPYSLDDISLIFNTNGKWGRSGNPGSTYGVVSGTTRAIDKIVNMIQQITYNVGHTRMDSNWYYDSRPNADNDFSETSAHELGHEIIQAFGGDIYSYQHKGSSYLTQEIKPTTIPERKWYDCLPIRKEYLEAKDLMKEVKGENAPASGEQDLMKYYHGSKDYNRIVAAEEDVKGLIWLTGIKILR